MMNICMDFNGLGLFSMLLEFILNNRVLLFGFICFSISLGLFGLIIIHMSGTKWVKMIINGVERLVLVTAGGVVINDALGNPVQLPGGRNPGGSGQGQGGGGNNSGNNTGQNSNK